jgi:hypothetical protein
MSQFCEDHQWRDEARSRLQKGLGVMLCKQGINIMMILRDSITHHQHILCV